MSTYNVDMIAIVIVLVPLVLLLIMTAAEQVRIWRRKRAQRKHAERRRKHLDETFARASRSLGF